MKVWRPEDTAGYFKPELNEFQKGGLAVADELQALGGGAIGLVAEGVRQVVPEVAKPTLEGVRDWGLDVYNRNMEEAVTGRQAPNVARIEDIKLGEDGGVGRLGDWAAYGGTKALGTLATIAATGGVGGAVAKAGTKQGVKQLAKLEAGNFATRSAQQKAAKTAARTAGAGYTEVQGAEIAANAAKELARNITRGQIAGASAGAFGLEGGSAFGEQAAQGVKPEDALMPSATVGVVNAALELTPFYMAAKAMGYGREARQGLLSTIKNTEGLVAKTRKLAGEVLRRGGPAALGGAAAEGITEGMQEIIQIAGQKWAQETPIFEGWGEKEWSRVKNAAAIGALVGGGVGGVIGQVGRPGEVAPGTTPPEAAPQETLEEAIARAKESVAAKRAIAQAPVVDPATQMDPAAQADLIVLVTEQPEVLVTPLTETLSTEASADPLGALADPIVGEAETSVVEQPENTSASLFTPTHETSTGVPVMEVEPGFFQDQAGEEHLQDGYVIPIQQAGTQTEETPVINLLTEQLVDPLIEIPVSESASEVDSLVEDGVGQERLATQVDLTDVGTQPQQTEITPTSVQEEPGAEASANVSQEASPEVLSGGVSPGITIQGLGGETETLRPKQDRLASRRAELPDRVLDDSPGAKYDRKVEPEKLADTSGAWMYSRTGQQQEVSAAQLEGLVEKSFGKWWMKKAKDLDLVKIHKGKGPEGVSGYFDRDDGSVHLFSESMPADENPLGVMLHEGSHQTLRAMLGDEVTRRLAQDTRKLAEGGNVHAKRAGAKADWEALSYEAGLLGVEHQLHGELSAEQQRVEATRVQQEIGPIKSQMTPEARAQLQREVEFVREEELLSYFTQFTAQQKGGQWRRIVNQIKAAWLESDIGQSFKKVGLGPKASDEMMVALARRATKFGVELRETARRLGGEPQGTLVDVVPEAMKEEALKDVLASRPLWRSPLLEAVDVVKQPSATGQQWVAMLEKTPGVKKEEGEDMGLWDWLKGMGKVGKEEVRRFVEGGGVRLEENVRQDSLVNVSFTEEEDGSFTESQGFYSVRPYGSQWGVFKYNTKVDVFNSLQDAKEAVEFRMGREESAVEGTPTKYSSYQTPGGENYRELLLTVPAGDKSASDAEIAEYYDTGVFHDEGRNWLPLDRNWNQDQEYLSSWETLPDNLKQVVREAFNSGVRAKRMDRENNVYRSSHWPDSVNVLAHLRFNEREIDGKRTLFVEEVQSDWHQEGRKEGYKTPLTSDEQIELTNLQQQIQQWGDLDSRYSNEGDLTDEEISWLLKNKPSEQMLRRVDVLSQQERKGVPSAPMKSSWPTLALKRAIRWAVDEGFDQVAWAGGEIQADRYSLTQHIDSIDWSGVGEGRLWSAYKNNRVVASGNMEDAPQYIGEEMARKIAEQPGEQGSLTGLDLQTGGEGMKGFYDKILPTEMNKYLKKFGMKVTPAELEGQKIWAFDVTEGLAREAERGMPLYSRPQWIDYNSIYTDPLSASIDISHNPGAFNKIYQNWVDMFSDLWAKAPHVARTFGLAKSKKGTQQQAIKELLLDPFVELGRKSGLSLEVLDDGFAAQHVLFDQVNLENARVKADKFAQELIKVLPEPLAKKLKARREEIRKEVTKNGGLAETARAEMKKEVDNMMEYAWGGGFVKDLPQVKDVYKKWERVKDYSGGFSTGEGDVSVLEAGVPNAQAAFNKVKDNPQWQEMNKLWRALLKDSLEVLVDGDLLTPEVAGQLAAKYQHYAPLKREGYTLPQELQTLMTGGGKTIQDRFGAEGYLKVIGVMQNGFAQRDMAIAAAEKNLALQVFAEDVKNNPGTWKGWFTVEERKLTDQGKDALGFESKTVGKLDPTDMPFVKDGKGFVIKTVDGNVRAAKIASAINNLEVQAQSGPMKVMQAVNSWVRAVNVSLSPVFMVVNPPRDFSTALLNLQSTEIAGSWKDVAAEYKKSFLQLKKYYWTTERDYADTDIIEVRGWEDEGGRMSFVQSLRPNEEGFGSVGGMIERRQGKWKIPGTTVELKSGKLGEAWTMAANALDKIERANIMMENVMRFSTYKVFVREGMKKLEAEKGTLTVDEYEAAAAEIRAQGAQLSKDITTNYDRKGFHAQALGTWYLFFNATMQGNAQVVRNLLTGPNNKRMQKAVAGLMATSLLMDLMAAGLSDDEDKDGRSDWDSIEDWRKEKQIFLPIGFGGEDKTYFSVPAPWVFNVFWRGGQMVGEVLRGVRDVSSLGPEFAGLTATTMTPIGGKTFLQAISPTAFDPLVQIGENRGPFGEKIRPENFPGDTRPQSQLSWSSTSEAHKWIAEELNRMTGGNDAESGFVDVAPGDVKILSDFVLGSAGKLFAELGSTAVNLAKGEGLPEVGKVPGLKSYLVNPKDPKESGLFHERVALVYGAERARKIGEGVEGRRELSLLGYAKDAERQVRAIRKQMRAAEVMGQEERVERLRGRVENVYQRFNQAWDRRVSS